MLSKQQRRSSSQEIIVADESTDVFLLWDADTEAELTFGIQRVLSWDTVASSLSCCSLSRAVSSCYIFSPCSPPSHLLCMPHACNTTLVPMSAHFSRTVSEESAKEGGSSLSPPVHLPLCHLDNLDRCKKISWMICNALPFNGTVT